MSTKTNGAEYKAYIAESDSKWWPESSWMEEELLTVDGLSTESMTDFDSGNIADESAVTIEGGTYYNSMDDDDPISLETHFKRWRKAQTTVRISVEVHKDKLDGLKAAIKANGGRVA